MEIKNFVLDGQEYTVKITPLGLKSWSIELRTLEKQHGTFKAEFIYWCKKNHLLFFKINQKIFKIKVLNYDNIFPQTNFNFYLESNKTSTTATAISPIKNVVKQEEKIIPAYKTTSNDNQSPILKSPLTGMVISIKVKPGDFVQANQPLVVIESMKMENEICAPFAAFIKTLSISSGNLVKTNQELLTFEKKGDGNAATKSINVKEINDH